MRKVQEAIQLLILLLLIGASPALLAEIKEFPVAALTGLSRALI